MLLKQYMNCIDPIGDGISMKTEYFHISVPNAKEEMLETMKDLLDKKPVWYPEYDEVADWLTDNKGKGLLLIGNVGCGKSFLTLNVLTYLIWKFYHKNSRPVKASEMNRNAREVLGAWLPVIDDVGVEGMHSDFGDKTWLFSTIVDNCMTTGRLLIANSNLTGKQLMERYSERTIDRLREICKIIIIKEPSLRGNNKNVFFYSKTGM